jgi:hypothetical protein
LHCFGSSQGPSQVPPQPFESPQFLSKQSGTHRQYPFWQSCPGMQAPVWQYAPQPSASPQMLQVGTQAHCPATQLCPGAQSGLHVHESTQVPFWQKDPAAHFTSAQGLG